MAHINLYLHNAYQASASYPFSNIDPSVNAEADSDADTQCGQGLNLKIDTVMSFNQWTVFNVNYHKSFS